MGIIKFLNEQITYLRKRTAKPRLVLERSRKNQSSMALRKLKDQADDKPFVSSDHIQVPMVFSKGVILCVPASFW